MYSTLKLENWQRTCEASRFDSNSNRTSRFEFDSIVTCRFENFESAAHAVCRHTTNYTHSLFKKNINLCTVYSWDLCSQLHFTCSCTAVAKAHTQLPHDSQHWTFKRLSPDSVRDSTRILIVAAYSIRYSIRTEISDSQVPKWTPTRAMTMPKYNVGYYRTAAKNPLIVDGNFDTPSPNSADAADNDAVDVRLRSSGDIKTELSCRNRVTGDKSLLCRPLYPPFQPTVYMAFLTAKPMLGAILFKNSFLALVYCQIFNRSG